MTKIDYCVYMIRCIKTGEKYIGRTDDIRTRLAQHISDAKNDDMTDLHVAIRKHGVENFECRIIKSNLTLAKAKYLEKQNISKYNTYMGVGYNMNSGG